MTHVSAMATDSKMTSDLGGFVPFNGHHAIVSCAVTLTFLPQNNLFPDFMRLARKAVKGLNLGISAPSYGINISFDGSKIGLGINRPATANTPSVGAEFVRSDDEGRLIQRCQATYDSILVQTYDYVRWDAFLADAEAFIDAVGSLYDLSRMATIKVEYVDRFVHPGPATDTNVWTVLRKGSPYLSPIISSENELWHSHCGQTALLDSGARRLHNAKIDVVDDIQADGASVRAISIITSFNDFLQPDFAPINDVRSFLNESLHAQHDGLKLMLADILNENASSRIGLK